MPARQPDLSKTYSGYIPFFPFVRFIRIIFKYGGISARGFAHLLPWLVKLILFEPLRWVEHLVSANRIARTPIDHPPVFILGHYRSGTTFLQRIFSRDTRFGTMNTFDDAFPDIMLLFEKPLKPLLQWISDRLHAQNLFHRIPFSWSHPGEEDLSLVALLSPQAASWGFLFPKKFISIFDSLFFLKNEKMIRVWKKEYQYLLQKLTLKHNGKTLLLKSPPNTARVRELLELFPGARFIYLHRDPAEVFISTQRLWRVVQRAHVLGSTSGVNTEECVYYTMALFQRNWDTDKKELPVNRYIEVDYHQLINHPADIMQQIYTHLELPDFAATEKAIQTFLAGQKKYKTIDHVLSEDQRKEIQHRLAQYIQKFSSTV